MGDTFTSSTAAFLQWFNTNVCPQSLSFEIVDRRSQNKGRSIIARKDLPEDDVLFSVPRTKILSVDNSALSQHEQGRALLADLDDEWLALILVMMYEHLKGPESPWVSYFGVLPTDFNTLMFWSQDELDELQGSAVKDKIGKAGADETFRNKIVPALRSSDMLFPDAVPLSDDDILTLAHRFGSIIMAYAFDIEKRPSEQSQDEEGYVSDEEDDFLPKGMVPMADLLNADAEHNNAKLFYEENSVVMRTIKPVNTGEELFNDYGPLPRSDLLRRYGYLTDNYSKYDVVEIATEPIVDVVRTMKREHGEDVAYLTEEYVTAVSETLDSWGHFEDAYDVSALEAPGSLFPDGLRLFIWMLGTPQGDKANRAAVISPTEQLLTLEIYQAVLERRMKDYTTTVDEDREMLRTLGASRSEDSIDRKTMAIHVRLGEKRLLRQAVSHVRQQIQINQRKIQGNATSNGDGARPGKRAKHH